MSAQKLRMEFRLLTVAFLAGALAGGAAHAQQNAALEGGKELTVERIYANGELSGHQLRGLLWAPDGKAVSFFENKSASAKSSGRSESRAPKEPKKEANADLWIMNAVSGERRILVPGDRLASMLPENPKANTQATGLGRIAAADYQWAPDGHALLFQAPSALVWFDLKSQTQRTLVSGKVGLADPKISPDGKLVSFIRDHNLWVVSIADGRERAITQDGVEEVRKGELDWVYPEELDIKTAYWWAPDSSAIAYFEMDESKVAQYPLVDFAAFDGEAEMERYPPAGGANPVVHVFVAALNGGSEPKQMDTGADTNIYIPRVNWLPDSKHLLIQRLNRAQNALDLMIADPGNGSSRVAFTEKDQYWINISDDLHFLRDGKRFIWSSERTGYRHLYLYDLDGKELAQLTKGDWEVSAVDAVDEKAGAIYFTATEKSPLERHLYRVGLDGSGFTRLTKEAGNHSVNFPSPAGEAETAATVPVTAFIDTYSNTMTPPRQELLHTDGSRIAVLNENKVPGLAEYHLSPVEFLQVKTHDGVMLNACMIKPPNFDPQKRYPVLVYTYGGPHVQVVMNEWGRSTFLWHQMMAQKGYIIFAVDNRGSAGRGHVFEEPIHFRFGAQELSDQRDGVVYLKSLSYVDAKRIGIWGWSYGGHMTLHAMFEDPQDFKAGFAGGPVTDWHFYDTIYTERYIGLLPVNEEYYQNSSPIDKAKQLEGKLLIAHGTGDDNVHFANTLALTNELIEDGKYVEVMPFPGRGHGVSDAPARLVLMERVTNFFMDNL
jgi:dipeptidyl-peptidase-4